MPYWMPAARKIESRNGGAWKRWITKLGAPVWLAGPGGEVKKFPCVGGLPLGAGVPVGVPPLTGLGLCLLLGLCVVGRGSTWSVTWPCVWRGSGWTWRGGRCGVPGGWVSVLVLGGVRSGTPVIGGAGGTASAGVASAGATSPSGCSGWAPSTARFSRVCSGAASVGGGGGFVFVAAGWCAA